MEPIAATDLEALLRRTLGPVFERVLGPDWQQHLSGRARKKLERTHAKARRQREGVPDDPWQSAGLAEIKAVVERFARRHYERHDEFAGTYPRCLLIVSLKDLGWNSLAQCQADFERLLAVRHDTAHPEVIEPLAAAQREEMHAIHERLRLGCE